MLVYSGTSQPLPNSCLSDLSITVFVHVMLVPRTAFTWRQRLNSCLPVHSGQESDLMTRLSRFPLLLLLLLLSFSNRFELTYYGSWREINRRRSCKLSLNVFSLYFHLIMSLHNRDDLLSSAVHMRLPHTHIILLWLSSFRIQVCIWSVQQPKDWQFGCGVRLQVRHALRRESVFQKRSAHHRGTWHVCQEVWQHTSKPPGYQTSKAVI